MNILNIRKIYGGKSAATVLVPLPCRDRMQTEELRFLLWQNKIGIQETWFPSEDLTCVIAVTSLVDDAVENHGAGHGFAWLQTRETRLYSCYVTPNCTRDQFVDYLNGLEQSIRQCASGINIVISGDFNSCSPLWGGDPDAKTLGESYCLTSSPAWDFPCKILAHDPPTEGSTQSL